MKRLKKTKTQLQFSFQVFAPNFFGSAVNMWITLKSMEISLRRVYLERGKYLRETKQKTCEEISQEVQIIPN